MTPCSTINGTCTTRRNSTRDSDLEEAWQTGVVGNDEVVVAVLDNGVQTSHPDLPILVNAGEIAGDGIDNDDNGYVDDVNGWDFVGDAENLPEDNNPNPT